MYFIGPLLFWACAEMTCGFLIFCVPSLPRIFKTMLNKPISSGATVEPRDDEYYREARRKWVGVRPIMKSVSRWTSDTTWNEIDDGSIALTKTDTAGKKRQGQGQGQEQGQEGSTVTLSTRKHDSE